MTAALGRAYRTARNGRTSATARAYTHPVATIAELVEDRTVDGVYAVARKRRLTTRKGKPYILLELVDPSGRIEGRIWDDVDLLDRRFDEGDAVRVLARVERFDGRLQLQVRAVEPSEADPAELAPALRRDADELEGFLEFLAAEIAHPGLAALVRGILADPEVRDGMRLLPAAGAEGHHGYAGGLLEHTVGVATLARETAQLHPARARRPPPRGSAPPRRRPRPRARKRACVPAHRRRAHSSATSSSACASSTAARPFSTPAVRAELLHAIASHHDRGAARTAEASVLYHANQLDAVAATRPVGDDRALA